MKLTQFIATTFAAVALTASSAFAVTYTDGDLILGIRSIAGQGLTTNYEVDLGSAASFVTGGSFATGSPVTLSLGNIVTDLVNTYGANWYTSGNLLFSISGVQKTAGNGFPQNTLFVTQLSGSPALTSRSVSASSNAAGKIQSMGQQFGLGTTAFADGTLAGGDQVNSTNSTVALLQPTGINQNSYRNNQPGGTNTTATQAFSSFTGGIEGGIDTTLDLYQLVPAAGNPVRQSIGTFNIGSNGGVSYTSVTAVPEPSTYAFMGFGALGLVTAALRRRKTLNA